MFYFLECFPYNTSLLHQSLKLSGELSSIHYWRLFHARVYIEEEAKHTRVILVQLYRAGALGVFYGVLIEISLVLPIETARPPILSPSLIFKVASWSLHWAWLCTWAEERVWGISQADPSTNIVTACYVSNLRLVSRSHSVPLSSALSRVNWGSWTDMRDHAYKRLGVWTRGLTSSWKPSSSDT